MQIYSKRHRKNRALSFVVIACSMVLTASVGAWGDESVDHAQPYTYTTQGHLEAPISAGYSQYSSPVESSYTTFTSRNYNSFNLSVNPSYFVIDNFSLGIILRVTTTSADPVFDYSAYSSVATSFGATAHYYFHPADRVALRLGTGYTFVHDSITSTVTGYPDQTATASGGLLFLDTTALYFFTPSVAAGPQFEYDFTNGEYYTGRSQFFVTAGFFIYL